MADINNADGGDEGAAEPLTPEVVEYEPVTGVPPEFCEYLPKDDFLKALPWLAENRSFGGSKNELAGHSATRAGSILRRGKRRRIMPGPDNF